MTTNKLQISKTELKADLPRIYQASELSGDFLRDESKLQGNAEYIAFPRSTMETAAVMKWCSEQGLRVTISGGRTGIAGGAVPNGGLLLSLTKMQKQEKLTEFEDGNSTIYCESGVLLSDLRNNLLRLKSKCFFPPDPTETSATIGGMIACNASGAHTYRYGPTRDYVNAIKVVLADGNILEIRRGESQAIDGKFELEMPDGKKLQGVTPGFERPKTKNAAGYFSGSDIDLIDLFIGSEGTLGVITEAELKLIPKPEKEFNLMFFLSSESTAVELTEALRNEPNVEITAIEYFDPGALALLRERRKRMGAASTVPPGLPDDKAVAALVIDIAADSPNSCLEAMETLKEIAKKLKSGESILEWAAFDRDERERLRLFRHALPETVNSLIGERRRMYPKITKLGTDMAVPDEYLQDILKIYRQELDKNSLDYVIFGHIGNNHVHVNILPKTPEEYDLGKKLYGGFAEKVLAMHGSISAEHGIGKLKTAFLAMMLKPKGIEQMRALKKLFDPNFLLGAGTLFE